MVKNVKRQKLGFSSRGLIIGVSTLLYFLLLRLTSSTFIVAIPTRLQDFATFSVSVVVEALPFVILGILLSALVQIWLPPDVIERILPRNAVLRRLVLSCFGVFMPVCECGNVPLARGLMMRGMSFSESLTFLLAAPILNPVTIITTLQAFGGDTSIVYMRLLGGLLIANLVGWIFSGTKSSDPSSVLTKEFAANCEASHHHQDATSFVGRVRQSFHIFTKETTTILPALFLGASIAALTQVFLPRSLLVGLGGDVVVSVFAMMALAFIVSICANVDAFFALAFVHTFTPGAIVSFLVFGPIVDIKMLILMKTTYQKRVLVTITMVTILVSASLGLAVNYAL